MVYVDKRTGSGELSNYLEMIKVPIEKTMMAFGDFAFLGRGEGEMPVPVGIERKALPDWISSFYTGRFSGHQLPGLLKSYQVIYVVIEGVWKMDLQTGLVVVPKTLKGGKKAWLPIEANGNVGLLYNDLEQMLATFEQKGGVQSWSTNSVPETCRFIKAQYRWWTDKAFDEHKSHLRFHTQFADKALAIPPTICRQVAAVLPGIGWTKSLAVATHFENDTERMCFATTAEWAQIKGVGIPMAVKIKAALKGKK